jgi:WD40 repeat protein
VVFSRDGSRVATGSGDGSARVFDAATGTEVCRLDHDGIVWTVVFSRDGSRVATGSFDGSARVFDAATGTEVCRLDHDQAVYAVVFSPDGTRTATGCRDGSARVWIVDHGQLIEQAEGRLTRNLTEQEWRRFFRDEPYRKTRADLP